MEWSIDYLEGDGVVHVKTSGRMTWNENKQMSEEAISIGRTKGVHTFFIDHQDLDIELSILEIDDLPSMYKSIGIGPKDKIAVLFNPYSPKGGLFTFLQNVSFIRSLQFRVFSDRDKAIAWLKSYKG